MNAQGKRKSLTDDSLHVESVGKVLASYPGPSARAREKKEGPGIHCLRMRQLH